MGAKNIDRLGSLPDEVLLHILDLVRTKSAVRTSILSKRWRHTWKYVTNLHFDDIHSFSGVDSFTKYVDRVLELYRTTNVNSFRLDFSNLWVPYTSGLKWIEEAVKLNVSELEIHFVYVELPRPFISKHLTKLTLVCDRHWDDWNITSLVDLPLLKTLDIEVPTNPNLNAFKIIHGCPLLESLSLAVGLHESDEVYMFNIPTLKRLKLSAIDCICIKKVVLNVPRLEDLILDGPLLSPFVMEDLPPLVAVTLSRFCASEPEEAWVELLTGISGAKSLTMHALDHNPSKSPMPRFLNLKHLEFRASYFYPPDWLLMNQIIDNTTELAHLCIKENKGHYGILPGDSRWIEPQSVPTCMLNSLRTINFVNFKGHESDIQFIAYILRNAQVLKTLTIMCDSFPLEKELRFNAELLKLPRVSRYCEVQFLSRRSCNTST